MNIISPLSTGWYQLPNICLYDEAMHLDNLVSMFNTKTQPDWLLIIKSLIHLFSLSEILWDAKLSQQSIKLHP